MKLGASQKINLNKRLLVGFLIGLGILQMPYAQSATYSISQLFGSAAYAPSLYGQTFLVPAGYTGTVSGVSNLTYQGYAATSPSVIWAKVWNSPSKTTLLATSSNTYTGPTSGTWTTAATFSLDFPSFVVTGGTSYYLEVGRSQGNGNFYISESSSNPYANGTVYHDGVSVAAYDLKFQIDISVGVSAAAPTLSLNSTGVKGVPLTAISTTSVAGNVNFKSNGKTIPNCQKIKATGTPLTASCTWKPAVKGVSVIKVTLLPSETSTYTNTPSASATILVTARTSTR
jgi:hypothetical protein